MAGSIGGPGPTDCNGAATVQSYYASAVAANPGVSGNRAFAVGTTGAIWEEVSLGGGTAPTEAQMQAAPTASVRPIQ